MEQIDDAFAQAGKRRIRHADAKWHDRHQILVGRRITPAEGRDERGIPVDPCRYGPAAPIHPFDLLLTV